MNEELMGVPFCEKSAQMYHVAAMSLENMSSLLFKISSFVDFEIF